MTSKKQILDELITANALIDTLHDVCDQWQLAFERLQAQMQAMEADNRRLRSELEDMKNPESAGEQYTNELLRLRRVVEMQGAAIRRLRAGQGPQIVGEDHAE